MTAFGFLLHYGTLNSWTPSVSIIYHPCMVYLPQKLP